MSEPVIPEGLLGAAPPPVLSYPAALEQAQHPQGLTDIDPDAIGALGSTNTPTIPAPEAPPTAPDQSATWRESSRHYQLAADVVGLQHL